MFLNVIWVSLKIASYIKLESPINLGILFSSYLILRLMQNYHLLLSQPMVWPTFGNTQNSGSVDIKISFTINDVIDNVSMFWTWVNPNKFMGNLLMEKGVANDETESREKMKQNLFIYSRMCFPVVFQISWSLPTQDNMIHKEYKDADIPGWWGRGVMLSKLVVLDLFRVVSSFLCYI